jgi:uncharacterized tellurite resistance protein B-like protein
MASVDRLIPLSDLLLGAAYADDHLDDREKERVLALLGEVLEGEELPDALTAWIDAFDPKSFNLETSCAEFAEDPAVDKRRLLELICAVHEADEELDFGEDDYLRAVARALDIPDSELEDLTLVVEVHTLSDHIKTLRKGPPPPPGSPERDVVDIDIDVD